MVLPDGKTHQDGDYIHPRAAYGGLVLAGHSACAFQMRRAPRHPPSTLHALPLPFREKAEPQLPKDVKDACRGAVQKALEDRLSRMDIEMPGEGGERA
ncbi:hypothetical protein THAOC_27134 [Thalassiosira oceanica]|uniref:Uncharacterized protein n=1 Tax=Thalassiosira oceanica TaxID=159749 RepID=K0RX51_THAOC|nr:hypothetical protein THAOC_27134 [Thalassiosira oceanica]|eukprot:EJK53436.1 hypothetical protein THAOC_27134 [Thalassiosira oceanica]